MRIDKVTGERRKVREEHKLGFVDEIGRKRAMQLRAEVLETINAGRFVVQSQIRFRDLTKRFVEVRLGQLGVATQAQYRSQIDNHLLPALGERKLCEIDRQAIEEFLSAKAESPTKCWAMWRPHELSEAPASKCAEDSEDRLRLQFSIDELSL